MAAIDSNLSIDPLEGEGYSCLSPMALDERLDEEIARAERHGTKLSCLLVVVDNLEELSREHDGELREQMLTYVGATLARELRRFDRVGRPSERELAIVLPGADGPRGEMVARRVLERMQAIKVEIEGMRRPLRFSVGLAAWRESIDGKDLLARARAATRRLSGNGNGTTVAAAAVPPLP